MGWSWGVYLIQTAHEHLLQTGSDLFQGNRASDFVPAPDPRNHKIIYSVYVDNVLVEGLVKADVQRALEKAMSLFQEAGLPLHEQVEPTDSLEMLGVAQFRDPPVVTVAPKKLQRLVSGIRYLLSVRKRATSHELERIVGHIVFSCLLKREALSLLHGCYRFCRKGYVQPHELWGSVREELH
eukprot:6481329-Amphidinium_carterae.1